jgi:hypothetical protein
MFSFFFISEMDFGNLDLKDFPGLENGDVNQVWKVLSTLQNSNPKKYKQFLGNKY